MEDNHNCGVLSPLRNTVKSPTPSCLTNKEYDSTLSHNEGNKHSYNPSLLSTGAFKPVQAFKYMLSSDLEKFNSYINDVLLDMYKSGSLVGNPEDTDAELIQFNLQQVKNIINKVYPVPKSFLDAHILEILERLFCEQLTDISPTQIWAHPSLPLLNLKHVRILVRSVVSTYCDPGSPKHTFQSQNPCCASDFKEIPPSNLTDIQNSVLPKDLISSLPRVSDTNLYYVEPCRPVVSQDPLTFSTKKWSSEEILKPIPRKAIPVPPTAKGYILPYEYTHSKIKLSPTSSEEDGLNNWGSPAPTQRLHPEVKIKSHHYFQPIPLYEKMISTTEDGFNEIIDEVLINMYQDGLLNFNPVEIHPDAKKFNFDQVKKIISTLCAEEAQLSSVWYHVLERLFFEQVIDIPPILACTTPSITLFSVKQLRILVRTIISDQYEHIFLQTSTKSLLNIEDNMKCCEHTLIPTVPGKDDAKKYKNPLHSIKPKEEYESKEINEVLLCHQDQLNNVVDEVLWQMHQNGLIPFNPEEIHPNSNQFNYDQIKKVINILQLIPEAELDLHIHEMLERLYAKKAIHFVPNISWTHHTVALFNLKQLRLLVRSTLSHQCNLVNRLKHGPSNLQGFKIDDSQKLSKPVPIEYVVESENMGGNLYQTAPSKMSQNPETSMEGQENVVRQKLLLMKTLEPDQKFKQILSTNLDMLNEYIDGTLQEMYQNRLLSFNPISIHPHEKIFNIQQVKMLISTLYSESEAKLNIHIAETLERLLDEQMVDFMPNQPWQNPTQPLFSLKLLKLVVFSVVSYFYKQNSSVSTNPPSSSAENKNNTFGILQQTTQVLSEYEKYLSSNLDRIDDFINDALQELHMDDLISFNVSEVNPNSKILSFDQVKLVISTIYPIPEEQLRIHLKAMLERFYDEKVIDFLPYQPVSTPSKPLFNLINLKLLVRSIVSYFCRLHSPISLKSPSSKAEDDDSEYRNLQSIASPPLVNKYKNMLAANPDKVDECINDALLELYLDDLIPFNFNEINPYSKILSFDKVKLVISTICPIPEKQLGTHINAMLERLYDDQVIDFLPDQLALNPKEPLFNLMNLRLLVRSIVSYFFSPYSPLSTEAQWSKAEDYDSQYRNLQSTAAALPVNKYKKILTANPDMVDECINDILLELYLDDLIPFNFNEINPNSKILSFDHIKFFISSIYPIPEEQLKTHINAMLERLSDEQVIDFLPDQPLLNPTLPLFNLKNLRLLVRSIVSYFSRPCSPISFGNPWSKAKDIESEPQNFKPIAFTPKINKYKNILISNPDMSDDCIDDVLLQLYLDGLIPFNFSEINPNPKILSFDQVKFIISTIHPIPEEQLRSNINVMLERLSDEQLIDFSPNQPVSDPIKPLFNLKNLRLLIRFTMSYFFSRNSPMSSNSPSSIARVNGSGYETLKLKDLTPEINKCKNIFSSNQSKVNESINVVLSRMYHSGLLSFNPKDVNPDSKEFSLVLLKEVINTVFPLPERELFVHIGDILERLSAEQVIDFSPDHCFINPSESLFSLTDIRSFVKTIVSYYSNNTYAKETIIKSGK